MRIVIKVGTSTLAYPTGHVNLRRISRLCRVLSDFKNAGHEVILVSSGAIGMGVGKLGLDGRPEDIQGKQAAAAVGQCELMYTYDKEFSEYHHTVAQILITGGEVEQPEHFRNFKNTMERLLQWNVLPIVNENDTVSVTELMFTDNDELSGLIAQMMDADTLILLSNIDGIYNGHPDDPQSEIIRCVAPGTDLSQYIKVEKSAFGRGGMHSKYTTASKVSQAGIRVIIANGERENILIDLMEHKDETPHTEFEV